MNLIKNVFVFLMAYLPPLLLFGKHWIKTGKSKIFLMLISALYIVSCIYVQNMIPFVFVIINILYMRFSDDFYVFNLGEFKIIQGIKYAIISYVNIIAVVFLKEFISNIFKLNLNQSQQIVNYMSDLPLNKFIVMLPVVVVFAPVLEEFVFRWMFFERIFRKKMGIYMSAFLSTLMFSIVHFSLSAFIVIFCIGIYNCYLIHNKGYWYAVFNHSIFNLVTMAILLASKVGA